MATRADTTAAARRGPAWTVPAGAGARPQPPLGVTHAGT